ncbi:MAG: hypothetical protein N2C14_04405, partial [Planctomycetales bacterium]
TTIIKRDVGRIVADPIILVTIALSHLHGFPKGFNTSKPAYITLPFSFSALGVSPHPANASKPVDLSMGWWAAAWIQGSDRR